MKLFFNHPYNKSNIVKAMKSVYDSHKTNHQAIADRYFNLSYDYLKEGVMYARASQLDLEQAPIAWKEFRNAIGRYKGQNFWLDWLHANYPLFAIKTKGNGITGLRTMVTPLWSPDWRSEVENVLTGEELFEYYFGDLTPEQLNSKSVVCWTKINQISLTAFIEDNLSKTERTLRLDENLHQAKKILKITQLIEQSSGQSILPQRIKESAFGRQYLIGPNLQGATKELRRACLGKCFQYDLEASVYAWKLDQAKKITGKNYPSTLEYLDHKDAIRKRVANLVFGNEGSFEWRLGIIKQALTAVGFGAQATNAVYVDKTGEWHKTSLRDIIKSASHLERFLKDPWVAEFLNEQKFMSNDIFSHYKELPEIANQPLLKTEKGTLSKNKTIAWLYQHNERQVIDRLKEVSKERGVLLMCHDAFYTEHPAPLLDIKTILLESNQYARIEKTELRNWTFFNEQTHKDLIQQEELKANGGFIPKDVYANKKRIEKVKKYKSDYTGSDEFDNGYRSSSRYDYEIDPFYTENNND